MTRWIPVVRKGRRAGYVVIDAAGGHRRAWRVEHPLPATVLRETLHEPVKVRISRRKRET